MMKLHSFDEWSPLRQVVVGSAEHYTHHVDDLSFGLFYFDNLKNDNKDRLAGYFPSLTDNSDSSRMVKPALAIRQRFVAELHEDVEGMAETFASLGVEVLRPKALSPLHDSVRTPGFSAPVLPPLNVRDNTLVAGDVLVETPPMVRARYFETQFLKRIFQEHFENGARWLVMPRPLMTDRSFDLSYAEHVGGMELLDSISDHAYDVGLEMMIDAAQCLRFGRDIIVNVSNKNHQQGLDWLERELGDVFRFHRLEALTDSHIDSSLMPLRPGLLLVRSPEVVSALPPGLRDWDYLVAPEAQPMEFPAYSETDLMLTSEFIDINVLSIDESTVCVNSSSTRLIQLLEGAGFDVVPIRHRHRRLFGGGLHCFTLDTVREGGLIEYF